MKHTTNKTRLAGILMLGAAFLLGACAPSSSQTQDEEVLTAALLLAHLEKDNQEVQAAGFDANSSINNEWRENRCHLDPGSYSYFYTGYFYPGGGSKSGGRQVCTSWFYDNGKWYQIWQNGATGEALGNPPKFQKNSSANHSRWGAVFHMAAVAHDMCYHHNPTTYGKTQKDCDQYFRRDMYDICSKYYHTSSSYWSPYKKCRRAADVMYTGVRAFGLAPYNKFNRYAPYLKISEFKSMAQYNNRK